MTVSSPNVIEIKLDRLIDEMRFLKSRTIAFNTRLSAIEAYLKVTRRAMRREKLWFFLVG